MNDDRFRDIVSVRPMYSNYDAVVEWLITQEQMVDLWLHSLANEQTANVALMKELGTHKEWLQGAIQRLKKQASPRSRFCSIAIAAE